MRKRINPVQSRPPQPPKEPETKEEVLERIRELEYARVILPKPHPRIRNAHVLLRWESLTNAINRYYKLLKEFEEREEKTDEPIKSDT